MNGIETPFTMTYDNAGTGDILAKSDLGDDASFSYEADTHALLRVDGVEADWGQAAVSLGYTDFGKVKTITRGNETYSIGYYPDNSRSHSVTKRNGTVSEERFYGDNYEIYRDSLGHSTYIAYLCHGAIVEYSGTTPTAFQGYYDAQGSLIALVDTEGNVVRRYAYDPWGRRVDPYDWTAEDDAQEAYHIARGYTMHEHLDDFELINMNGRIYDPYVAQFLSPDNYIQDPSNWMNYNRYAYCLDNPIAYTDPDGELFGIAITQSGFKLYYRYGIIIVGLNINISRTTKSIGIYAGISFTPEFLDFASIGFTQSLDWNFTKKELSTTSNLSFDIALNKYSLGCSYAYTWNISQKVSSTSWNLNLGYQEKVKSNDDNNKWEKGLIYKFAVASSEVGFKIMQPAVKIETGNKNRDKKSSVHISKSSKDIGDFNNATSTLSIDLSIL